MARMSSRQRQITQIAQVLQFDKHSGRFFAIGAILAVFRMLWVIGQTSGLFGQPADQWMWDFEKGLGTFILIYALLGFVALMGTLYLKRIAEDNEPITPIVSDFLGVVFFLLLAERVSQSVIADPREFATWAGFLREGIIQGGVYALIALGYTLVYGILFMINFAHGEVMMLGAYGGWFALIFITDGETRSFEAGSVLVAAWAVPLFIGALFLPIDDLITRFTTKQSPVAGPRQVFMWLGLPVRFLLGALVGYGVLVGLGQGAPHIHLIVITVVGLLVVTGVGMLTSSFVAVLLERIAYRPLRKAPRLTPLISAIGASIFLQQVALLAFPEEQPYATKPILLSEPATFPLSLGSLGEIPISKVGVVITLASLGLMALLYFIVIRTKFGKAMRAVAEDKDTAALMGIDVDRVIVLTFVIGAALAGAAGVMLGFRGESIKAKFGFKPGLKAFTAAVLGGIGNIPGAMLGGFFLGIVEALGPRMLGLGNEWTDSISFALLVAVIIFRPTGILGEAAAEKKV